MGGSSPGSVLGLGLGLGAMSAAQTMLIGTQPIKIVGEFWY